MKTNIKNFLRIIRRFKMAVALNILGLSVAFAAFMVIMMQLHYDFSFDKSYKEHDRIFRVEFSQNGKYQAVLSRPFIEQFIESSPYIVAGALTNSESLTTRFHIEKNGEQIPFEEESFVVTPDFFKVFSFDFVEGSIDTYISPSTAFIPLSLSRKLYGNEPAVGKQFYVDGWGNQTVMAVYRDFPQNSSLNNCLFFAQHANENKENWQAWSYIAYIRVNDPSNASVIIDNFKRNFEPPEG